MNKHFLLPLFLFVAGTNLSASVIYRFAIDTTSLAGQSANLDFQLTPDGPSSAGVNAAITGFSTNGTYDPTAIALTGDAAGALPNTLVLDNGTFYNDAFQPITLGTFLNFFLTLNGPGIDTPAMVGSTFAFSLYDGTGTTPLLTNSSDGSIAGVTVNSVNGIQPYTNPPATGTPSDAAVTTVPEPGTYLLMSLGLAAFVRRFRR